MACAVCDSYPGSGSKLDEWVRIHRTHTYQLFDPPPLCKICGGSTLLIGEQVSYCQACDNVSDNRPFYKRIFPRFMHFPVDKHGCKACGRVWREKVRHKFWPVRISKFAGVALYRTEIVAYGPRVGDLVVGSRYKIGRYVISLGIPK
jgi:hypothetical protein